MRPRAWVTPVVVLILSFSFQAATAQEASQIDEIRSFLRAASSSIPRIDKFQQSSLAFNIAREQTRIGDLSEALATVRRVVSEEGSVSAMGSIASVLAGQGDLSSALDLVRNSAPGNERTKAYAYLGVAQALAWKHSFHDALSVVQAMGDEPGFFDKTNLIAQTLMSIQTRQWEAGDYTGAEDTLNLALNAVEQERAHPFTSEFADTMPADLYGGIASKLSREGNRQAALSVVERIYATLAAAESEESKQHLLHTLTVAQANLGEFQEALSSSEKLASGQWRDGVLLTIAMERTREGDPLGAIDEATQISSESWRNSSLRGIADALAASGNYVQALTTVERIQPAGERAYGLSELALEQAEKDDPAAALIVRLAWEAALNAGDETKPFVFEQIAVTRGILGDYAGALEIVSTMAEEDRVWPLQNLTAMLVHAGKKADAIALAES